VLAVAPADAAENPVAAVTATLAYEPKLASLVVWSPPAPGVAVCSETYLVAPLRHAGSTALSMALIVSFAVVTPFGMIYCFYFLEFISFADLYLTFTDCVSPPYPFTNSNVSGKSLFSSASITFWLLSFILSVNPLSKLTNFS